MPSVNELVLLLARFERLNEALLAEECQRHGLTPSELRVLAALVMSGGAPLSPTTIGRWIVQTSGGLTATLRRLEERGLVERREDPDDGRGRLVAPTDEGEALHAVAFAEIEARYATALVDLDVPGTTTAVRELVRALERTTGSRTTGGHLEARLGAVAR